MSGIYLHIPFCRKKCTYCDFHFSTRFEAYRLELIDKIAEEITWRSNEIKSPIRTVYFGGGTPSLLSPKEHNVLWGAIKKSINIDSIEEVTLEVNPEDITSNNLSLWKKYGVNRLSIGVQSLSDSHLSWMNRAHSSEQTIRAIDLCLSNGFQNISVDFIYGLPGLDFDTWVCEIQSILTFPIKHVSAYILTVENNTKLHYMVKNGRIKLPNENDIELQYHYLCSFLKQKGFKHYEVSSFCQPGFESLHNTSYWSGTPYFGFGPSAHSFYSNRRRWNISNNKKYLQAEKFSKNWFDKETLTAVDVWNESILTGLRTKDGFRKKRISSLGGFSKKELTILNGYLQNSVLKEGPLSYFITESNWLIADKVSSDLFRINE